MKIEIKEPGKHGGIQDLLAWSISILDKRQTSNIAENAQSTASSTAGALARLVDFLAFHGHLTAPDTTRIIRGYGWDRTTFVDEINYNMPVIDKPRGTSVAPTGHQVEIVVLGHLWNIGYDIETLTEVEASPREYCVSRFVKLGDKWHDVTDVFSSDMNEDIDAALTLSINV